ncbi:hypothetical protein VTL71DRAFT_16422 [Oculimacula yallundae]|uniref:Carboxylesterase type B domain-containing protein n=1 Tax=Oculimacula yallundae TaxID=86028 RepID=A0ABR4CED1_9HELO
MIRRSVIFCIVISLQLVVSTPNIAQLGSDITILTDNDLYVLCTQSPPLTTSNGRDTSPPFRITATSSKQTLTGFCDRHTFLFLGIRFAAQAPRLGYSQLFTGPEITTALAPGPWCVGGRKETKNKEPKAVIVWIFGGGFVAGGGYSSSTDGGHLSSCGDVAVVAFNHRVGAHGFPALKDGFANGNYGIGYIIAASEWVKENI